MTNAKACDIVQSETKNNYFTERTQHHEDHFFRYLLYERMAGYKETPQEMAQIVCDWEASSEEK